jgi:hypothetical protein
MVLPLCLSVAVVLTWKADESQSRAVPELPASTSAERLVVVVVDSLRPQNVDPPGDMPRLSALARTRGTMVREVVSCSANFTLPCMQTMMEGRPSPFSSGLHNVSGATGSASNIIASARAQGIQSALMSDATLSKLYGRFAARTFDVDDIPLSIEERDLDILHKAEAWLAEDALRLQVIHVTGTDYIAHYQSPGSEGYRRHFQRVDEALARYAARLDTQRDHLLVLGDHGHDEGGHHTRQTLFIAVGPRYAELARMTELPPTIDQTEIAWLIAYPLGIALPASYEGRHFLEAELPPAIDDGHAAAFVALQRASLSLGAGQNLADEMVRRRDLRDREDRLLLLYGAPLLLAYLLWLVVAFEPDRLGVRRQPLFAVGGAAFVLLLGWLLPRLTSASLALASCAVPLVALLCFVRRLRAWRVLAFCGGLMALAAVLGYAARPWAALFHTRDGFQPQVALFYLSIPAVGACFAWVLSGRGYRGAVPHASLAVAAVCLPAGVYYYQAGQNLLWGFLLGVLAWTLADALRGGRLFERIRSMPRARVVAAVAFVAVAAALVAQEAGGWVYSHYVAESLARFGTLPTAAAYLGIVAPSVALMTTLRARVVLVVVAVAGPLYATGLGQLPLSSYVTAALPMLLAVLALYVGGHAARIHHRRHGFLLVACALAIMFIEVRGFFIEHMDYAFAMAWARDLTSLSDVALLVGPATALKYACAVIALVVAVRGLIGRRRFVAVAWSALVLGNLKVLALLLQSLTGRFDRVQKLHELAMSDLVFVVLVVGALGVICAVIQLVDRYAPSRALARLGRRAATHA